MPLTAAGKISTLYIDLTQAKYIDQTVYGAPELDRNEVGIAVYVVKKDIDGAETDLSVVSNNTDPATDTEWTFEYPEDGWFRVFMFHAPNYSGATTYSQYDAVYDTSSGKFYRSKTNSNTGNAVSDTANWEELTTPGKTLAGALDTSEASGNITYLALDDILRGYTSKAYGELVSEEALLQPQEFEPGESSERYWAIAVLMESMSISRTRSLWSNGEKVARKAEEIIDQC